MILGYQASQVRAAEAVYLQAGIPLMQRAAFGLTMAIRRELRARRTIRGSTVLVLAGPGNNGADGIYAAADLVSMGVRVIVVALFDRIHEASRDYCVRAGGRIFRFAASDDPQQGTDLVTADQITDLVSRSDVVLDAILGTGSRTAGALPTVQSQLLRSIVGQLAQLARKPVVIAVDQPTGVDGSTGMVSDPDQVLHADLTVTFGAAKTGLLADPGAGYVGKLDVVEIGIADELSHQRVDVRQLDSSDVARYGIVTQPPRFSDKYTRGVLGVMSGSAQYPGAAVLSVGGAVGTSVGMVRYSGPDEVARLVLTSYPQAVVQDGRVQALVIGPGLDGSDDAMTRTTRAVRQAVQRSKSASLDATIPAVLDATALSHLQQLLAVLASKHDPTRFDPQIVLTPHYGELARILADFGEPTTREQIATRPLYWARRAQELTGATVVLKGPATVICGRHDTYIQHDGTSWLATAGSGDVLAGITGALLAQHAAKCHAQPDFVALLAASAVVIHGQAARQVAGPVSPSALVAQIPKVVQHILTSMRTVEE